jgi:RHS repeat-associated protein
LALTNDTGAVTTRYSYDPFGNTTVTGTSTNVFQYTGRENDGTGLYYYRARYYSPKMQRFVSEDPIGFNGGDINLYAYARNNPVRYFDPWGLRPGDSYPTADAAAIDAIQDINQTSINEGREHAGRIYGNPDGTYSYTEPNRGTRDSSYPGNPPDGKRNEGYYHTHGANDPGYDNEVFSPEDKNFSEREGKPGYVGTPGNQIKKYIPKEGPGKRGPVIKLRKLGGRKE